MPIEVKELHIRVSVGAESGGGATSADTPAGAPSLAPGADLEIVVALCVEQVMQVLHDRAER